MRVRDHIALSTAGAGLLGPWIGGRALGMWAGSVLIDADHYLWFCLRERRLNPRTAVRYFNRAHPARHSATRALHTPAALVAALLLGVLRRELLPVAAGMGLHVALDAHHEARMGQARAVALERDGFCCRACGAQSPQVGTHLWRQPPLLASYEADNLVSLCARCHEAAHASGRRAGSWR